MNLVGALVFLFLFASFQRLAITAQTRVSYSVRFYGADHSNTKTGILQVLTTGSSKWLFLDPDSIGLIGARLACRQLGYPYLCEKGATVVENVTEGDVFDRSTHCLGEEDLLEDCPTSLRTQEAVQSLSTGWAVLTVTCASNDDIETRLVNGTSEHEGIVEYRCSSKDWRNICSDEWYPAAANTLCNQLGFGGAVEDVGVAPPTAPVATLNFFCTVGPRGHDHLFDCLMEDTGCYSGNAASVVCGREVTVAQEDITLCDASMTCKGNCGNATRTGCRCDRDCRLFRDCCFDFDDQCGPMLSRAPSITDNILRDLSLYSCQKPLGGVSKIYDGAEWYFFIRTCPRSTDANLRSYCEDISLDENDVIRKIPVYDRNGDVYYNVFCAVCQGQHVDDLTPWRVEAEPEMNFFTGESRTYYVVFPPWNETGKSRPCYAEGYTIDTCSAFYEGSLMEMACMDYQAPIRHVGSDVAYRNPHCLRCQSPVSNALPIEYCTGCECQGASCFLKCIHDRSGKLASVTLLFDFATSDDEQCTGLGEVYDMFLKRCRVLMCPTGTVFVQDACVQAEISETLDQFGSSMECLTSSLSSSLHEVHQIIIEHNMTTHTITAFIFTDNVNNVQSVDLTLGALFSFEGEQMLCNFSRVLLMAAPPFNESTPTECNDIEIKLSIRNTASSVLLQNASDTNITQLLFNDYVYINHSFGYQSTEPSESCWFELFNALICELQVVPENEFYIDAGNLAYHIPSGAALEPDEYFLLHNKSLAACADSLEADPDVQAIVYMIGAIISIIFLIATLITYSTFPKLRNIAGKCLLNVAVALLGANLIFVLNPLLSYEPLLCSVMAALAHFFWLGCFGWMNVVGFNMARTFGWNRSSLQTNSRSCSSKTLVSYALCGWGVPFVIVAFCIGIHACQCTGLRFQYGGPLVCWIDAERRALMYVVGIPIYSSIVLNVVLLAYTAISLIRHRRQGRSLRAKQTSILRENLIIVSKLCVVLGTAWTFGVVYSFTDDVIVMYIFVILTSLQGVLMFLFFGATKQIRRMWKNKFRKDNKTIVSVYTVRGESNRPRHSIASSRTNSTSV